MNYPFVCPKCGFKKQISMKMSEYIASGHLCPNCQEEMKREISSMTFGMMKDLSGDFYKKTTF